MEEAYSVFNFVFYKDIFLFRLFRRLESLYTNMKYKIFIEFYLILILLEAWKIEIP